MTAIKQMILDHYNSDGALPNLKDAHIIAIHDGKGDVRMVSEQYSVGHDIIAKHYIMDIPNGIH
jgi:hypothetical protein